MLGKIVPLAAVRGKIGHGPVEALGSFLTIDHNKKTLLNVRRKSNWDTSIANREFSPCQSIEEQIHAFGIALRLYRNDKLATHFMHQCQGEFKPPERKHKLREDSIKLFGYFW